MKSLQSKLDELYLDQQQDWPVFSQSVQGLKLVHSRSILVANTQLEIQNNPARIRSTAAKIDAQSLAARACFLCSKNRPSEQRGFELLSDKYLALVNPFPVLPNHYTVVSKEHIDQEIIRSVEDFLDISSALTDSYSLLFNGAKAGASAPDHLHFQIVPSLYLPLYNQLISRLSGLSDNEVSLFDFAGITYLHFNFKNKDFLVHELGRILKKLSAKDTKQLDLINLMAFNTDRGMSVFLAPRKAHRPSCFSAEGANQFLLSPAAIELCGVIILPRPEDFERIDSLVLQRVFNEVCWARSDCEELILNS